MMGVGKMRKDNGGPAFPFGQTDDQSGQLVNGWGSEGMSIRDYFAAKAMQSLLARRENGTHVDVAENSYLMADAMLAERAK
jgi:hypothetical protein